MHLVFQLVRDFIVGGPSWESPSIAPAVCSITVSSTVFTQSIPNVEEMSRKSDAFVHDTLERLKSQEMNPIQITFWRCETWLDIKQKFSKIKLEYEDEPAVVIWASNWIKKIAIIEEASKACMLAFNRTIAGNASCHPDQHPDEYKKEFDKSFEPVVKYLDTIREELNTQLETHQQEPYAHVLKKIDHFWGPLTLFAEEPYISYQTQGIIYSFDEMLKPESKRPLSLANPASFTVGYSPISGQVKMKDTQVADLTPYEHNRIKQYLLAIGERLSCERIPRTLQDVENIA